MEQADSYGLAALGKAGVFTVMVQSRPDGRWSLYVESPAWCFAFELVGPGAVAELAAFLRSRTGHAEFAELVVGSFGGVPVWMVKDDESADRFFLRAAGGGLLVDLTLIGGTAQEFADAVAEAAAEFETEQTRK